MNYLQLNEQNFQEYLFDIENATLMKKSAEGFYMHDNKKDGAEFFDVRMEQKGQIYVIHENCLFKQNIILDSFNTVNIVTLFFIKQGGSFSVNKKTGSQKNYLSNTHGMFFMKKGENYERDILLSNKEQGVTVLQIPIPYYEHLVNQYPDLFEQSFLRYQEGESFFLNENFSQTTAAHYNILSQIENSHLMGTCSTAYVDAKVLELLSLYFRPTCETNCNQCDCRFAHCDKISEAASILLSDMHAPPSVRELSLMVGVNPNILRAGFRELFNTTVYGYLFDYKMQLAEQLLRDTDKPVGEIAEQCGYDYTSHFCTAFKRKFGVSPKEKRKDR